MIISPFMVPVDGNLLSSTGQFWMKFSHASVIRRWLELESVGTGQAFFFLCAVLGFPYVISACARLGFVQRGILRMVEVLTW